MVQCNFSLT